MASLPDISLPSSPIFEIGALTVTNSMVAAFASMLIIIVFAFWVRRGATLFPTRSQMIAEMLMEFMLEKMQVIFGSEKEARRFFPLIFTIFIFLMFANQFTLIPFVQSVVIEGKPLFRTATSDYSLPIALGLLLVILSHLVALTRSPLRHISNFIKLDVFFKIRSFKDIPQALMDFFLGLLDIIGELAKLVSISTRLFGNMFAGEVVVGIVAGLMFATQFVVPIPFIALSILSGFVQAFVFALLGTIYIASAVQGVESSPKT